MEVIRLGHVVAFFGHALVILNGSRLEHATIVAGDVVIAARPVAPVGGELEVTSAG